MFLVLTPMTSLLSLRERPTMKGSLKGGRALFLVVTRHSSSSFLEVITFCWDPALRCITIGDVDLVSNLEEYDFFTFSFYSSKHCFRSTSADTLLQKAH